MATTWKIARSILDRIVAETKASPAQEVCGLLLGRPGEITAAQPCRNVAAAPATRFEIDPAALLAAHRAARAGGPALVGCYHSHPSGRAQPSPRDAADAAPDGSLWLVAAGEEVTGWLAVPDGALHGRFEAVGLRVVAAAAKVGAGYLGMPMTISPVDYASLLCSRLCHDLLSPVGALNNGLELLADEQDPAMRARCMELLAESARVSANKLKFFRLAFGAAGGFGDAIDAREAKAAIEGLLADHRRTTLGWYVEAASLPKPAAKVLLNLALIAGEALVRGGTLDVGAEGNGGQVEIVVKIEGPRIILDPDLRRMLTDGTGADGVTARNAGAYLVHALAAEHGGGIQVSEPAHGVMILGAAMNAGGGA